MHTWVQKMGEILKSEDTVTMESKHGIELMPEGPSNPLDCLLKNSQVSTLTCPPVVPHQESCVLPEDKNVIRPVTNLQNANVCLPILKLHRLQAKDFRRFKDIAKAGINKECAKALRNELQRFRRNARRRDNRKFGKAGPKHTKLGFKRKKIFSEDFGRNDTNDEWFLSRHPLSHSHKKSVIKCPRPATNGSITDLEERKCLPAKKARLHLPYQDWQHCGVHSSSSVADPRVPPLDPQVSTVLSYQHQATATHPSLMTLPWLSSVTSLPNRPPHTPRHSADGSLMMPEREILSSPSSESSMGKYPTLPAMMPLSKIQTPAFAVSHSGKAVTNGDYQPRKLFNVPSLVVKAEDMPSLPSQTPQPGKAPVPSLTAASPPRILPTYPVLTPKCEAVQSSVVSYSSLVTHPKTSDSEQLPIPPKLPPLIRLPPITGNFANKNPNKPKPLLSSSDLLSSKIVHEQSFEKSTLHQPENHPRINSSSRDQTGSGPIYIPHGLRDPDGNVIYKPSNRSKKTLESSNISNSGLSSPKSLSMPNILPNSSSSVGLNGSPMVLIPASVAFETLGQQVPPQVSHIATNRPHVKSNSNPSLPVPSATPNVPAAQYYWILSPKVSSNSASVSESSVEPSHDLPASRSSSVAAKSVGAPLSVSYSNGMEPGIMAPPPVSSSSCLASLLKAGVPLVPVSSTAVPPSPHIIPSTYLSAVSGTPMTTSICIPAPIMSTPPIIADPKHFSKQGDAAKCKSSRPGPKSSKKRAPAKSVASSTMAGNAGTSTGSPLAGACTQPASGKHSSDSTQHQSTPSSSCILGVTNNDSFKINDIINTVLGESSTVRYIMDSVRQDCDATSKTPRKVSSKKNIKNRKHLDGTIKSTVKKLRVSKSKASGKLKLPKKGSSIALKVTNYKSSEKDTRTAQNSTKYKKCAEKELPTSASLIISRTVITNTSILKDEHGKVPSSGDLMLPTQSCRQESPRSPARVEYVPVISRVKQSGLFTPPCIDDSPTSAGKTHKKGQVKSSANLGKKSKSKKPVMNKSFTESNGSCSNMSPLIPKNQKKKYTTSKGAKGQIKKNCLSGKTLQGKKNLSEPVKLVTKKKKKPISVLRNVNLHTGASDMRSTHTYQAEYSDGKTNESRTLSAQPAGVTSRALTILNSEAPNNSVILSSLLTPATKVSIHSKNGTIISSSSMEAEISHLSPIIPMVKVSSLVPFTGPHKDSSLTPLQHNQVFSRVCLKTLSVRVERLTHRHIKREFLKKYRIGIKSGILLRRRLRNFDIKRYLRLRPMKPPPLPAPVSDQPSQEPVNEQHSLPIISPLSAHQVLWPASSGMTPDNFPSSSDVYTRAALAPHPGKCKSQKGAPPNLKFMGEHKNAVLNNGSGQTAKRDGERTSDKVSNGIISCNRKQLLVFRNERLSRGQIRHLAWIGLGLAKRVSRNSDLDSLEGSHILMDPGMFGLKGNFRPPPSWSLVLDSYGSRIENNVAVKPHVKQSRSTMKAHTTSGHLHNPKSIQPALPHGIALSQSQMYTTNTLPSGHIYSTTFMAPGQLQTGQGQSHFLESIPSAQDGSASLPSLQGHTQPVVLQRRIYAPTMIPQGHVSSSAGVPPTALVQTTNSPLGARILSVDHTGRVRETLSQGIPAAYSRYPTAHIPDCWNPPRPSGRSSPPPPLTFMGGGGLNSNVKAARIMPPPPLSFMGPTSDTSSNPALQLSYSQSSIRPSPNVGTWTHALDLSMQGSASRNYGVINHTRHVTDKRPPPPPYSTQGHIGLEQQPAMTYSAKGQLVMDKQQSQIGNTVQGHSIPNQHLYNVSQTIQGQRPPGLSQCVQGQLVMTQRTSNLLQEAHRKMTLKHQLPNTTQSEQRPALVNKQPQADQGPFVLNKQAQSWPFNSHNQTEINQQASYALSGIQRSTTLNQQAPSLPHSLQGQVVMEQQPPSLTHGSTSQVVTEQRPRSLPHSSHSQILEHRPPVLSYSSQGQVLTDHRPPSLPHSSPSQVVTEQRSPSLPCSSQGQVVMEERPPSLPHSSQGQVVMEQLSPNLPQSVQGSPAPILETSVLSQTGTPDFNCNQSSAVIQLNTTPQGEQGSSTLNKQPSGLPQGKQGLSVLCKQAPGGSCNSQGQVEMNQQALRVLNETQRSDTLNQQPLSLPQNSQGQVVKEKQSTNLPHSSQGKVMIEQRPPSLPYSSQGQIVIKELPPSLPHSSQAQVLIEQRPPSILQSSQGQVVIKELPPSLPHSSQARAVIEQRPPSILQISQGQVVIKELPPSLPHSSQAQVEVEQRAPSFLHNSQGQVVIKELPPSLPHSSQSQDVIQKRPPSVQGSPVPSLQTPTSSRAGSPDSNHNRSPADIGWSADEPEHLHHHKPRVPGIMAVVEALVLQLIDIGLPSSMNSITKTVEQLFQARGMHKPFCCKTEAMKWYQDFHKTHVHRLPTVDEVKTSPIPTDYETREWLINLRRDMVKFYGVTPRRLFYMQELNFFLDKQTREIKYHRMFPGMVQCSNEKDTVTVLFVLGADGQIGPGMIIFPRMVMPEKLFSSLRNTEGGKEWVLGSSMNGWLYSDCISEFVSDVFVPWLKKRNVHFPVALFTNECLSNIPMMKMSESFMVQGIQLITVPKMMSSILSPAEWIVADYFRTSWGKALYEWSVRNNSKPLLEENFAPFMISCLTAQATPDKVNSQFRKFGICPFDAQAMFQCLRSQSYQH
nr:uncharacterized protein LOC123771149 isoform X2 [Procambarus clarkii]